MSSEIEWPVQLYAAEAGRRDLLTSTLVPARACRGRRACYVVVQTGRLYAHKAPALERLARVAPVHLERIRGAAVVKVYRLGPGELVFPELAPSR